MGGYVIFSMRCCTQEQKKAKIWFTEKYELLRKLKQHAFAVGTAHAHYYRNALAE